MWDLIYDIPKLCINLKNRKDNKKYMMRLGKKKNLKVNYLTVNKHKTDPKRGCLESHLKAIDYALRKKWYYVLILEDDIEFWKPLHTLTPPPDDWDMLYLGGTVRQVLEQNPSEEIPQNSWVRMTCWTTHAYVLNLRNEKLLEEIRKAANQEKEIDTFYSEVIHPNFRCYMYNPMIMIQKPGYSEIEGREVKYDFMPYTISGFKKPEHEVDENNNYILKLADVNELPLPTVSIITPTKNRRHLFSLAIENFNRQNYPKEKMEWIILDEATEGDETVLDLIPKNDKRIKYVNLTGVQNRSYTVAHKRNIGVDLAENQIIVHMDDDDYYPAESVMSRVRILQKYYQQGVGCVGSSLIGTHNLIENRSGFASDGPLSLSEASMAYFKTFWEKQKWDVSQETGEYRGFIGGRVHQVMDVPYSFIIIALSHNSNLTKRIANSGVKNKNNNSEINFIDTMDEETQFLLQQLSNSLKFKKYLQDNPNELLETTS